MVETWVSLTWIWMFHHFALLPNSHLPLGKQWNNRNLSQPNPVRSQTRYTTLHNSEFQVFHMCQLNGRANAFLCPVGTLFDQRHLVCNWWNKVDCSAAPSLYFVNENIYQ